MAMSLMRPLSLSAASLESGSRDVATPEKQTVLWEIPQRRRALLAQSAWLREELAGLPAFSESRQIDSYGFHGGYLPVLEDLPDEPRWTVDVKFGEKAELEQIFLVPAIDPRFSEIHSYGFPRRFRISVVLPDGTVSPVSEWLEEDAPDLDYVPRAIKLSEPMGRTIRLEVFQGEVEGEKEYFAMGEVFGVSNDNIWNARQVEVNRSFESLPYWSKDYLADQKTGLGMPLGAADQEPGPDTDHDFITEFNTDSVAEPVVALNLGRERWVGWVSLFPPKAPDGGVVPGFGFPGNVEFYTANSLPEDRNNPGQRGSVSWDQGNPGDNVVRIPLYAQRGRWLMLKFSNLAEHDGQRFIGLGEISVHQRDELIDVKSIHLLGFPEGAQEIASRLVNGQVGGRPVLTVRDWFRLIDRQYRLNGELERLVSLEAVLNLRWSMFWHRLWIVLAVAALMGLAVAIVSRQFSLQRLRLRIAEEHHQAELEQTKLRFFTHISHELRTPLSVIQAPIERAIKAVSDQKLKDYMGMALRNVGELQQLVEQILELRRIHDGKMRIQPVPIDAVELVGGIVDSLMPLASDQDIELVFEPKMEHASVCTDPHALKRVLGNLTGNALKYTPAGGRVLIGLSMDEQNLVCSVEDTGPGISEEDLPHIFEQHFRTESAVSAHVPGSGIGLALVHELVELMSGTVRAESPVDDGRGTRFVVNFALAGQVNDEKA